MPYISNSYALDLTSDWITSKIETVYSAIYYRKQFDVVNYVTFRWMTCSIMRPAMPQFERKLQKCIRMGITIFKIFIWGHISSEICSGITFYGSACTLA